MSRARDLGRAIDDTFDDGITSLTFRARYDEGDDDASVLLVTSWDGTTRAYECRDEMARRAMLATHDVPVLCGTFLGTCNRACVGLLDGSARVVCLRSGTTTTLGAHARSHVPRKVPHSTGTSCVASIARRAIASRHSYALSLIHI